jgi:predicted deacetylase
MKRRRGMMGVPTTPFIEPGVASQEGGRRNISWWWSSLKSLVHRSREAELEQERETAGGE